MMIFNIKKGDRYKIGVYCISNKINNKIYIGSTGNSFYSRYHQHISDYKKGKHNGVALKRAFDKYGINNFEFSIVCICSEQDRLKMEQFYIDKGVDYNCAIIAGSMLGYRHKKNSKTRTVIKGHHHSAVKVDQYSIKGVFVKSWSSIKEAKDELGIKSSTNISHACSGKVFSSGGFRWAYKGQILSQRVKREGGKCKVTISKNGLSKQFDSQKDAANYIKSLGYKCNQGRITRSLFNTKELVYGFKIVKS